MPVYTYRREDNTTFEFQQDDLSDLLTFCPTTGQKVVRLFQSQVGAAKGSFVNNSKKIPNRKLNGRGKDNYMRLQIASSTLRSRGKKL